MCRASLCWTLHFGIVPICGLYVPIVRHKAIWYFMVILHTSFLPRSFYFDVLTLFLDWKKCQIWQDQISNMSQGSPNKSMTKDGCQHHHVAIIHYQLLIHNDQASHQINVSMKLIATFRESFFTIFPSPFNLFINHSCLNYCKFITCNFYVTILWSYNLMINFVLKTRLHKIFFNSKLIQAQQISSKQSSDWVSSNHHTFNLKMHMPMKMHMHMPLNLHKLKVCYENHWLSSLKIDHCHCVYTFEPCVHIHLHI